MNNIEIFMLKALRKIYRKLFAQHNSPYDRGITDPEEASALIYEYLKSDKPCMIARYGSTELLAVTNYIGVNQKCHSVSKYIMGETFPWWWEENIAQQMKKWSGFFPPSDDNLRKFGELMLEDSKQLDILGSWLPNEQVIVNKLSHDINRCSLLFLEPYWASNPWSRALEGKKVLVVHPFAELIKKQYYENRKKLFEDKRVLPRFASLRVIKAVQSLNGDCDTFPDWFVALEWMKREIDKEDYDVCLIGCGAYGFPLAAHVKRTGHKAVHIGGALQLLFGIRGRRWDNPDFGMKTLGHNYLHLFNEYWIYPNGKLKPKNASSVESGCYW